MTTTTTFTINRKVKGTRTLFFATFNGKRFNNTNFCRKWEAVGLAKAYIKHYGVEKLNELSK